jgi:hypothetical protein
MQCIFTVLALSITAFFLLPSMSSTDLSTVSMISTSPFFINEKFKRLEDTWLSKDVERALFETAQELP